MNNKMTTNLQLSTPELKKKKKTLKQKWTKQTLEQEQIPWNRDHMEGYQWVGGGERKVKNYRK